MNTKTAAILVGHPTQFQHMQSAELKWWKDYAHDSTARHRMYALYGARYMEFFWRDFHDCGDIVEFGSGPMPAMLLATGKTWLACDRLMPEYVRAGLVDGGIPWVEYAGEVPSASADTALLLNVLDHTDQPFELLQEAHRALRPGGKALIFVHLENEDDKHRKITVDELAEMLCDFTLVREHLKPANDYDPAAYLAVVTK